MKRLRLAHLPTPLVPLPRIGDELGIDLWVKRDDATGGAESGNKIRKLEYLLAAALEEGADTVITCGGVQSNHARATAVVSASLGMRSVLLLRSTDGSLPVAGNVLLDLLVGADIRVITPDDYRRRHEVMARVSDELRAAGRRPYVIPEGGSNALGSLGYVAAMEEVRQQTDAPFDVVLVACGSGGTAAGIALGAAGAAEELVAVAVCNDEAYFRERIGTIMEDARALDDTLGEPVSWRVEDRFKGPAYGVSTEAQRQSMIWAGRRAGVVLDPVYSGKAFHALVEMSRSGELAGKRVLFVHTGGLPGLLAQSDTFGLNPLGSSDV